MGCRSAGTSRVASLPKRRVRVESTRCDRGRRGSWSQLKSRVRRVTVPCAVPCFILLRLFRLFFRRAGTNKEEIDADDQADAGRNNQEHSGIHVKSPNSLVKPGTQT